MGDRLRSPCACMWSESGKYHAELGGVVWKKRNERSFNSKESSGKALLL